MKSLLLLLGLATVTSALADGLPTAPYIYVQGAAETRVEPDMLTLGFGLTTTDRDQAKAKAAVSEKSAAVFKLLEKLHISDDAIVAHAISVNENYEFTNGKREFNGYTVSRAFSVRLNDLKLYPELVNGLVDLRVESIDSAQPGYSKATESQAALKKTALEQARQQAEDIATGMDMRVTAVFAVSPIAFGEIPRVIFGGSEPAPYARNLAMVSAKGAEGDKYIFDKLTFSERLHVIFLIEPRGK
jgi:uncharacterized protein YggE